RCRETDAEMAVAMAENVARDDEQVVADGLGHEVATGSPGSLGKEVKCTAGLYQFEALAQALADAIPLRAVVGDDAGHVEIRRGDARILYHAGGTDESELLELDHLLD